MQPFVHQKFVAKKGNRNHGKKNPNQSCVFLAKLILFHDANQAMQNQGSITVISIFNFFMIFQQNLAAFQTWALLVS
jgi:hypothetical protein